MFSFFSSSSLPDGTWKAGKDECDGWEHLAYDDSKWSSYIADLPGKGNEKYILSFADNKTLYEKKPISNEVENKKLQMALKKASFMELPNPKINKIFTDSDASKQIQQIEFMTRIFLVESDIIKLPWKLTAKKKQLLEYVCFSAELKEQEVTVIAYYSPEIPTSIGPGKYSGLPGAILAIEKDEVLVYQATSVNIAGNEGDISIEIPDGEKRLTQEEFASMVNKKTIEYKREIEAKSKKKRKGN